MQRDGGGVGLSGALGASGISPPPPASLALAGAVWRGSVVAGRAPASGRRTLRGLAGPGQPRRATTAAAATRTRAALHGYWLGRVRLTQQQLWTQQMHQRQQNPQLIAAARCSTSSTA